ncbi:hypothetical protein C5Q97_07795 [Victivallales bacterium CCUG 44730]|nr:hypothetical protein C5Q97_07795 [Victivallales bacterium CCUG 44730]
MQEGNPGYPRLEAGRNMVIEKLPGGFRIHSLSPVETGYRGYFTVRPYPSRSTVNPQKAVQIVNGSLPYEESVTRDAGFVSVDRLHWIKEEKGGPGIGARRLRIPVPCMPNLAVPAGRSLVFLRITAHSGGNADRLKFPDSGGGTVYFVHDYQVLDDVPKPKEGVIYIPLAEVECDDDGGCSVTQLNCGEPNGVIMQYFGSDTLDRGDDAGSSSSGGADSSSASGSDSTPGSESSGSGDPGSGSGSESASASSGSGTTDSSGSGSESASASSGSGATDPSGSGTTDPSGSGTTDPSGSGGGGGGHYDPDLWYLVADCTRYLCHESIGIPNYSGTVNYYMAKGDKIKFEPEPSPPTAGQPIVEWHGIVMIEGPFQNRLDVTQEHIDELNNLHIGDEC